MARTKQSNPPRWIRQVNNLFITNIGVYQKALKYIYFRAFFILNV
jgi:membrane-bound lytic murein transglycosylase MltF